MASGNGERLAVDGGLFKQAGPGRRRVFHFAIGDFGDFQFRGDGLRDAAKLAGLLERFQEMTKGREGHILERLTGRKRHGKAC